MTTNKKLANYTGNSVLPSSAQAVGAFVSPSEVYQQKLSAAWPATPAGAWVQPGDIIFALSSGVVCAISGTNYAVCDGSAINRTAFSSLFNLVGIRFGPGDGVTTFNTPSSMPIRGYFKNSTVSGLNPYGSGVLPTHTHTLTVGNATPGPQASNGGGGAVIAGGFTFTSSASGQADNHGKHVEVIPLISNTSQTAPAGTVVTCLTPNSTVNVSAVLPPNVFVASGQAISRTTYSELFGLIGTLYGSGNGTTTFNLPDYRGVFLRAPVGRSTIQPSGYVNGTFGPDSFIQHAHTVDAATMTSIQRRCDYTSLGTTAVAPASSTSNIGSATENRPANMTVVYSVVVQTL
jgi:microcystin-dependent protein